MKTNRKITAAVLAALGAHGACFAADAAAADSGAGDSDLNGVQEVTVTAQRRTESVQDVPITIQAITGEQLKQLNVTSFEDVVKYLPNVSFGANGPGQGEIFMRGLSAGPAAGEQSSASILPFPNVAVYLDDQSVQFPGRNLDIYMADMERIEVLEGPQGTLFGGGAEAGAIRYITNKPNLTKTEGDASAMYGTTAHGDNNSSVQAMLNVPVIEGTFALRGVIYDEQRGGYIDNVPSTFTRSNNDPGSTGQLQYTPPGGKCANGEPAGTGGYCVPSLDVQGNNFNLAGRAQNPTTYGGIRVEALWQVNDDWSALLSQSYQNMEADGSPAQYPYGSDYMVNPSAPQQLGPWEGTFFSPIYDKDRFENTALTINGKVGPLSLVYSGAYLIRHVDQTGDYTNYARSGSGYYYDCSGPSGTQNPAPVTQCYSPVMAWHDQTTNSHLSNELRLSTPDNWLVRGLLGLYQENFTIGDNMNFQYNNLPGCTAANLATTAANAAAGGPNGVCVGSIGPVPSSSDMDPNPRNSVINYGEDERRGYSQYAFFTSWDVDLIPKVLTLTGGTRYYHYQEYEFGTRYDGNCVNQMVCTPIYGGGNIIDPPDTSYHGFRSRGNLTWHITSDIMAYYTFSQGFRPGGFNRFSSLKFGDVPVCANGSTPTAGPAGTACAGTKATAGAAQYQNSYSYAPDTLTNNEIGFKTEWLDHRVQFNASLYDMEWKNAQFVFFDPTDGFGSSNFVTNGPNYRIKGIEIQLVTRPIDGLTVQGSSSWNSSEQENAVCLPVNNPALPNYGQCISQTIKSGNVNNITSPLGEPGSRPAFSPPMQFSLQARYDWNLFHDYKAFLSAGASHTGGMFNQPAGYPTPGVGSTPLFPATSVRERFYQPGYTTYDASGGVSKDRWTVTVYGQNLSNSDASTYTNTAQYIEQQVPLRPRVLGLRVDYKF